MTTAPRTATIHRQTSETNIQLTLTLDGKGVLTGDTGVGFFDHMLSALARHGGLDIQINAEGDRHIDDHHLVEDVGIVLGQALAAALGEMKGIQRFGDATVPLDESLVLCAVDLSGRPHLSYALPVEQERIGTFETYLAQEFFQALVNHARMTLHLRLLVGGNAHHRIEAAFKAFARALRQAVARTGGNEVPSTKGKLV